MLRRPGYMIGYLLQGMDGIVGEVCDFLFDDRSGKVRHIVVDVTETGEFRDVLLPPECVREVNAESQEIMVTLSEKAVLHAPGIESDPPVWWQRGGRGAYFAYGLPWALGGGMQFTLPVVYAFAGKGRVHEPVNGDPHLRSVAELATYAIRGVDGRAGYVRDFLMCTDKWVIEDIVVRMTRWLPGREVLLPWFRVQGVDYDKVEVRVDRTRNEVKNSPWYDPAMMGPVAYGVGG